MFENHCFGGLNLRSMQIPCDCVLPQEVLTCMLNPVHTCTLCWPLMIRSPRTHVNVRCEQGLNSSGRLWHYLNIGNNGPCKIMQLELPCNIGTNNCTQCQFSHAQSIPDALILQKRSLHMTTNGLLPFICPP